MIQCNRCKTDNTDNSKYCKGCGYELPQKIKVEEPPVVAKPKKKFNVKVLLIIFVGLVMVGVIAKGLHYGVETLMTKVNVVDLVIQKSAEAANKSCPMMVDEITRLDNVTALPGKTLQYNYTIFNIDRELLDTTAFKDQMRPQMIQMIQTMPEMSSIRDYDVTLKYVYKDEAGDYLFKISIDSQQYKTK